MARLYLALAMVIALATPSRARGDDGSRVRVHLTSVLAELRTADTTELAPAQRAARETALGTLEAYTRRGVFPRRTGDAYGAIHPRFIDDRGVHCAVGELIAASGHEALARAINRDYEYAYVRDMHSPALAAWAREHGFTVDELARIQPGYSSPPTPGAVRQMIDSSTNDLTLTCAADHEPLRAVTIDVTGDAHGVLEFSTPTPGPFAACVARTARERVQFGGAWRGQPEAFSIHIPLQLATPQSLLDARVAELGELYGCQPRPGPVPRQVSLDVKSDANGLSVLVMTRPHNAEVEICGEQQLSRELAWFRRGVWTIRAKRTFALGSPLDLARFHEALKMYASHHATDCAVAGSHVHVEVTAHTDDPAFTIRVDAEPVIATCIAGKLQASLHSNYEVQREHAGKVEHYFRIDRDVHDAVDIEVETREARDKRTKPQLPPYDD